MLLIQDKETDVVAIMQYNSWRGSLTNEEQTTVFVLCTVKEVQRDNEDEVFSCWVIMVVANVSTMNFLNYSFRGEYVVKDERKSEYAGDNLLSYVLFVNMESFWNLNFYSFIVL